MDNKGEIEFYPIFYLFLSLLGGRKKKWQIQMETKN